MMFEAVNENPAKMTSEIPAMTCKFDVSSTAVVGGRASSSSVERSVLEDRASASCASRSKGNKYWLNYWHTCAE